MIHREYKSDTIAGIIGAEILPGSLQDISITDILIDSRRLITPDGCFFFALVTGRNDGHRYIRELYGKGVRAFVISGFQDEFRELGEATFYLVGDTLSALQKLATWHRKQFTIPVIGITGSNGKTIVKE